MCTFTVDSVMTSLRPMILFDAACTFGDWRSYSSTRAPGRRQSQGSAYLPAEAGRFAIFSHRLSGISQRPAGKRSRPQPVAPRVVDFGNADRGRIEGHK